MIDMPTVNAVRIMPGASIGDAVLASLAREQALRIWEQQMTELMVAAERMEQAMAVAADPSAEPSQRRKALAAAERFHEHLQERWHEIEEPSRSRSMDAFLAMGVGASAMQLTSMAEGVKKDLQLPAGLRTLLETFNELKEDLVSVLNADLESDRRPDPQLEHVAAMLMTPGMSPF